MVFSSGDNIQDVLAAWGAWVLADGNGLGYKSPLAMLMRGHVVETRKRPFTMYISDDDALDVERHITRLCKHNPLEGKLLMLKYVERMSDRAIARYYLTPLKYGADSTTQVSAYKAANLISYAEGFMIASLFMQDKS